MANASDLSLRGGQRPTWRPEREARGSALGVQSREGSHDFADNLPVIRPGTARLPRRLRLLAMTRQGSVRCTSALLRLNYFLPGARGAPLPAPSGGGCHFNDSLCESFVQHREGHAPPLQWRVPRNGGRYGTAVPSRDCHVASLLAMTRQGSAVVHQRSPAVELLPTGRSLSAATVKFGSDRVRRHSVYIGSAFPRLPRARSALAMTNLRTLHR